MTAIADYTVGALDLGGQPVLPPIGAEVLWSVDGDPQGAHRRVARFAGSAVVVLGTAGWAEALPTEPSAPSMSPWPVVDAPIAYLAPGYRSRPVVMAPDGEVARWEADGSLRQVWRTPSDADDAIVTGLPDDRLLVRLMRGSAPHRFGVVAADGTTDWLHDDDVLDVLPAPEGVLTVSAAQHGEVVLFDVGTGDERWRAALEQPPLPIGVVADTVWATTGGTLHGLDLATGTPVAQHELTGNAQGSGVLDSAGRLHLCNGASYQIADLTEGGTVIAHFTIPYDPDGPGTVTGSACVPIANGIAVVDQQGRSFLLRTDHGDDVDVTPLVPGVETIAMSGVDSILLLLGAEGELIAIGPTG